MKIAIITYNQPHLKTEQILLRLIHRGYKNITIFAQPFIPRKTREFSFFHRPNMQNSTHLKNLCKWAKINFVEIDNFIEISTRKFDFFLIGGSGLIPKEFVIKTVGRVINVHPGIIPLVRGLDAFKWAIYDNLPLGNTLHFIDVEADSGEIIYIEETPVFNDDKLEILARRHYENEIELLVNFEDLISNKRTIKNNYSLYN